MPSPPNFDIATYLQTALSIPYSIVLILFLVFLVAIALIFYNHKKKIRKTIHQLKNQFAQKEMHYQALVENSPDIIVRYDNQGRRIYVNQTYQRITGIPLEDLIGKTIIENSVVTGEAGDQLMQNIMKVFQEGAETGFEVKFNVFGRDHFYDYHCIPEKDHNNKIQSVLAVGRDITSYKEMEIQLQNAAKVDVLTGIYNRRSFMERMFVELGTVKRHQTPASLLLINIDHFKRITDKHGPVAGKETLVFFSNLIKSHIRITDVFGRLGGTEFAVLLHMALFEEALGFAERMRKLAESSSLIFQEEEIKFTISIGVTLIGKADIEIDTVFKRAIKALNQARLKGRNRVEFLLI